MSTKISMSEDSANNKKTKSGHNEGKSSQKSKTSWKNIVGNTTFTQSRNIASKIPCEKLYLKFEGNNPTGTQKDRIAMALVEDAKKKGFKDITTATCGNFGVALAFAAEHFSIKAHIYIPEDYHLKKERLKFMESHNANVIRHPGHYEDTVYFSSDCSHDFNWYNANPGMNGSTEISVDAYEEISHEIFRAIRKAPDYIFCPVGNGTTLSGIYSGFKKLKESGKITNLPRMVGVSTRRGNPIVKSYKLKSKTIMDLKPDEITETKINEPLTNWHSFDGQLALDAIYESNGFAEYATDSKLIEFARMVKHLEGLNVLPASAGTLAVMSGLTKNDVMLKGTFVAILSGREY